MTNAVSGADVAHHPSSLWTGQLRRLVPVLIALSLAVTLVAVEAPRPASAGMSEAERVVYYAKSHLGAKFRLGTEGLRYFDCSGLVYRVFKQAGLVNRIGGGRKLARGYYRWFKERGLVSRGNPRTGDLIVYTKGGRVSHIAIAISGKRAISALTSGVRKHRHKTLDVRFLAYLHVRLKR